MWGSVFRTEPWNPEPDNVRTALKSQPASWYLRIAAYWEARGGDPRLMLVLGQGPFKDTPLSDLGPQRPRDQSSPAENLQDLEQSENVAWCRPASTPSEGPQGPSEHRGRGGGAQRLHPGHLQSSQFSQRLCECRGGVGDFLSPFKGKWHVLTQG